MSWMQDAFFLSHQLRTVSKMRLCLDRRSFPSGVFLVISLGLDRPEPYEIPS